MKRLFGFAVTALAALAASAADYTWSGGTATDGPANAKEFADGDNWTGGAYPNDKDAVADVKAAGKNAFLTLDANPVTLNKLTGSSAMLLGSKTLTFEKDSANKNPNCNVANFYTPVKVASGQLFLYGNWICDTFDVADGASIMANNTSLYFHDDYWAPAAGGERTFSKIPAAYEYHGSYAFFSPRAVGVNWYLTLTKDSPFATSKSGWAIYDRCSAGQLVSGPGIKDGTYVKRIFDSMTLELSEPATDSVVDAAVAFAPQTVKITRAFGEFGHNSSTDHSTTIYVDRHAEDEDYAVEVDKLMVYPLAGSNRRTTFSKLSASNIPGKLIVHNTKYPGATDKSRIALQNCYIEFGETTYDTSSKTTPEPGFPWSEVEFANAAHTARLGVQAELSAVIPSFLSFKGTVEKVGPGTLTVGFAAGAETTGSVVVKEGSFGFADDAEAGTIVIGSLTVKAGATFVVPAQGVRVSSFAVEPGAIIAGSGTLYLPEMPSLMGVTLAPTVTLAPDAVGAKAVLDLPAPATAATLPGDPAFWVDCSNTNTMTLVTLAAAKAGSTDGVFRINDVRKTSDGDKYLFSTNCSGNAATAYLPVLQYDKRKKLHHVYFEGNRASPLGSIFNTDAHAWSRPVADIRVVFEVYGGEGSGTAVSASTPFLGSTSGARHNTVLPAGTAKASADSWSRYSSSACFFSWASAAMKAGAFHVNGEAKDVAVDKPPYGSPLSTGQTHQYYCHPMVADLTIPDTKDASGKRVSHIADAYTFSPTYGNQGCVATEKKRLFELIVYTNALTQTEIASVRRYLMRKWLNQDAPLEVRDFNPDRLGAVNGGLEIAAGESYYAESVAGDAAFVKKGAGSVYVENAYAPAASVSVAGGTLKVRSFDITKPALTEGDQVTVHWDASKVDDDHFTYAEDPERGVKTVTKWKDVKATSGTKRDASIWKSASTNKPFIAENKLNGLSVLDFGPFYEVTADSDGSNCKDFASAMTTAPVADNHAVIAVWGSEHGGGTLLGEVYTYWSYGIGLARNAPSYGALASDPICRSEIHQSFANPSSYLCRKNGVSVDPQTTGLSGAFDIVSHVSWSAFDLEALQAIDNDQKRWLGGGQFGEMIVCKMGLSSTHLTEVEAYLQKKWFDKDTDGYREASLGTVSVGTGATLEVTGGGRLHVGTLAAAGGMVKGDVVLAADAALQAVVNADGSISPVAIDGSIAAAGGTVTFVGTAEAFAALQPGQYELISGLGSAAVGDWTVDVSTLPRKFRKDATVFVRDGKLYVQIFKSGLAVIVR